jgi:hypothetical protein
MICLGHSYIKDYAVLGCPYVNQDKILRQSLYFKALGVQPFSGCFRFIIMLAVSSLSDTENTIQLLISCKFLFTIFTVTNTVIHN